MPPYGASVSFLRWTSNFSDQHHVCSIAFWFCQAFCLKGIVKESWTAKRKNSNKQAQHHFPYTIPCRWCCLHSNHFTFRVPKFVINYFLFWPWSGEVIVMCPFTLNHKTFLLIVFSKGFMCGKAYGLWRSWICWSQIWMNILRFANSWQYFCISWSFFVFVFLEPYVFVWVNVSHFCPGLQ